MVTFVVLRIVAVVLLIAANAFFVAAEFALVSVRETRLQQMIAAHRIGARTVQKLHQKLDLVLNAVQFGVTVSSLALGWIGEASIAHMLEPLFLPLPHSQLYAHGCAVVLAFALMTYLVVIMGEVVPKSKRVWEFLVHSLRLIMMTIGNWSNDQGKIPKMFTH